MIRPRTCCNTILPYSLKATYIAQRMFPGNACKPVENEEYPFYWLTFILALNRWSSGLTLIICLGHHIWISWTSMCSWCQWMSSIVLMSHLYKPLQHGYTRNISLAWTTWVGRLHNEDKTRGRGWLVLLLCKTHETRHSMDGPCWPTSLIDSSKVPENRQRLPVSIEAADFAGVAV